MINIPSRTTKKINQNNRSKILGDIWSSFNLDLQSNLGVIKVSPRLQVNTAGVSNQGLSVAFQTFNSKIYTLAGTRIFNTASIDLTAAFTEDVSTGAVTNYSSDTGDLKTFNVVLCSTSQTKVKSFNGSAWTDRATITTGLPHKLLWFIKYNHLYYLDNNGKIKSLDSAWTEYTTSGTYAIDLTNGFEFGFPYTLDADSNDIWVGMSNIVPSNSGNDFSGSYILRWDGFSAQITTAYKIKARGVLALCKDDRNIMHAIDTNGALLQFTGSGFEEIGRLPLNRELLINANSGVYNSFVHPNGVCFTRNGTFIVNVNNLVGDNAGSIKENMASGIWEFSKDTGFVHRQSFSYNILGNTTVTDHGQNRVSQVGALVEADIPSNSANGKPTLICGAIYYTDASTTSVGVFVDDPLDTTQKYGYLVSSWVSSQGVKDAWNKFVLRFRQFLNSGDKIIAKFRIRESSATEIAITWVNTTSFTTTTNLLAMVGYEVEVIQGTGSGKCAHIVTVVNNSGTYTVTVDETFTGVTTGTAKARIQNWTKLLSFSNQLDESASTEIGKSSERIQLKVCMQFTGEDELHELALINNNHEKMV